MTPLQRRIAERLARRLPTRVEDPGLSRAAVSLVFAPDPDAVLLIRRAERTGDPWSGQMGLPGGRRNPADADLLDTAMRETREEVGIALSPTQLVGPLDDVAPRSPHLPPLMVRPYLFLLDRRPQVILNAEVADHLWIEWESLVNPDAHRSFRVRLGDAIREFPAYHVSPVPIWGMTERILAPLVSIVSAE